MWIAVLAMAAAMAVGGCGSKATPEGVLAQMQEAQKKVEALEADWNMDMGMSLSMMGMAVSASAKAEGSTGYSGESKMSYTSGTLDVDSMGEQESMPMQIFTEMSDDNSITMYLLLQDQWLKTTAEVPEGEEELNEQLFADVVTSLTLADETVKRDDAECYQLEADIPVMEALEKVQELSDEVADSLEQADADLSMFRGKVFHVVWYVAKDTSLPRELSLSLTEGEKQESAGGQEETGSEETAPRETEEAEEEPVDSEAGLDYDVRLDNLNVEIFYEYPDSVDVAIPQEARENAVDLEDLVSLGALEEGGEDDFFDGRGSAYEKLSSPVMVREFSDSDPEALLVDEKGVQVRMTRVYTDGGENAYADLQITNNTDRDVELFNSSSAWNHVMGDFGIDVEVKAGETETGSLNFPRLSDLGGEISTITLRLICSDSKTYDEVFSEDNLEVKLGEEAPLAVKEGGNLVYEDDVLQVTAYAPDESEDYMASLPMAIWNKTDKGLSVSSMTVTIGGEEAEAYIYGELYGNSLIYTNMEVYSSDGGDVPELKDVALTLEVVDTTTYDTVLTTEVIHIP